MFSRRTLSSRELQEGVGKGDQIAASAVQNVVKSGWMFKRGESSNWKKRFVIVAGARLFYYEKETDDTPKGVIALTDCTSEVSKPWRDKPDCVSISTAAGRKYYFYSEEDGETAAWLAVVQRQASETRDLKASADRLQDALTDAVQESKALESTVYELRTTIEARDKEISALVPEAAAAIELRKQVAQLQAEVQRVNGELTASQDTVTAKSSEIERLSSELIASQELVAAKSAEIERLTAELTASQAAASAAEAAATQQIEALRGEVAQVRQAAEQKTAQQASDAARIAADIHASKKAVADQAKDHAAIVAALKLQIRDLQKQLGVAGPASPVPEGSRPDTPSSQDAALKAAAERNDQLVAELAALNTAYATVCAERDALAARVAGSA